MSRYVAALDLASAIVASTDGPAEQSAVRHEHADAVARLRDLAVHNLVLADGDVEFVYGLQALMAFEDGGVWQRNLHHLTDGELPCECPNCNGFLTLDLENPGHASLASADGSVPPTPVRPGDPDAGSVGGRLLARCRGAERPEVAARLRFALGAAACPTCRGEFDIQDALARHSGSPDHGRR